MFKNLILDRCIVVDSVSKSKELGFDVEAFLSDYLLGKVCLSGSIDEVKTIRNKLSLPHTDYYEEYLFGIIGVEKQYLYVANRVAFGESFVNLLRYKQVEVNRLRDIYPLKKYCQCCGQTI